MREPVFCLLVGLVLSTLATPDGYFHQQYQYKSSSSSFKNDELEHKSDDEGFYSNHGDLEGRTKPKVNSYSQHSEYTNPKFAFSSQERSQGYQNDDFYTQQTKGQGSQQSSSYGNQGTYGSTGSYGNTGQYGSSSSIKTNGYSGGASFGTSQTSGGLYPTNQLQSLMQQLQNDLSRNIHSEIQRQPGYQSSSSSSYHGSSNHGSSNYGSGNLQLLEQELRRNLTQQLQDSINQFQHQHGSSYQTANTGSYNTQQLEQLRRQLEDQLTRQLHEGIQTHSLSASQSSSSSSSTNFGAYGTGTDFYNSQKPGGTQPIHITPGSSNTNSFTQSSGPRIQLVDVSRQVERGVIDQIDKALTTKIHYYQSQPSYSLPDYNRELQALTNELQRNLTRELDNEIIKNYGRQDQRGSYYYTTSSSSNIPNYRNTDLENIRQQLQDKLLRELQEKFRQQYNRYTSIYGSSSSSNYHTSHGSSPSVPVSSHYPGTSGVQTVHVYNPGSFVVSGDVPMELKDITRNVHGDIVTQLQTALAEQQRRYLQQQHTSSSYQSSSYNPQEYQLVLQRLTDELKRNITDQLQQSIYRYNQQQRSSYSHSTGGYNNYSPQQIDTLSQQLQNSLIPQLQQGLSYSYSSSASYKQGSQYSGSTGGSYPTGGAYTSGSYSPTYSNTGLKQFMSGGQLQMGLYGEDCEEMQADDSFVRPHQKEELFEKQRQSHLNKKPYSYNRGQQKDSSEYLTQETEGGFGQLQIGGQYKVDSLEDLTQQHQSEFGQLQIGGQKKIDSEEKYTQQTEDGYSQLQIGGQHKMDSSEGYAQQHGYGKLQIGGQYKVDSSEEYTRIPQTHYQISGQEKIDSSELVQQTEHGHGKLQIGDHKKIDSGEEYTRIPKTQHGNGQLQIGGQKKVDSSELTQQTETGYGQLQIGGQVKVDSSEEYTQQTENGYGQLQIGSQKKVDSSELTQQTENQYGQEQYNSQKFFSQQTQNGYGKLHVGGQPQQVDEPVASIHNTYHTGSYQPVTHAPGYHLQQGANQPGMQLTQQQLDIIRQLPGSKAQVNDLVQKTENENQETVGYGKLNRVTDESHGQQQQTSFDQHTGQEEDLTQQTEEGFGKVQFGGQLSSFKSNENDFPILTNGTQVNQQSGQYGHSTVQQNTHHPHFANHVSGSYGSSSKHDSQYQESQYQQTYGNSYQRSSNYGGDYNQRYGGRQQRTQDDGNIFSEQLQQSQVNGQIQTADNTQQIERQNTMLLNALQNRKNQQLSSSQSDIDSYHPTAEVEEVNILSSTTQRSFWGKVGDKIQDTYHSAKHKAETIADKISTSVG